MPQKPSTKNMKKQKLWEPTEGEPNPLICKKCGAEVPPGLLVCTCFQADLDNELEERALTAFQTTGRPLYLTVRSRHIMPSERNAITLCRQKRYQHPETRTIGTKEVKDTFFDQSTGESKDHKWCAECLAKAQVAAEKA
jgi:hypothetical protein